MLTTRVSLSLALALALAGLLPACSAAAQPSTLSAATEPAAPHPPAEPPPYPIFRLGGFGDLEFHSSSEDRPGGLDVAEIDLYSTAQLTDRLSALVEVLARRDHRDRLVTEVDLERLFVAYAPSDFVCIEAGQTHTGIVQWNDREHRSRLLQTPIDVPAIARPPQDDGAWPLRFVGVWVSGRVEGPLGLKYGVAAGYGSGKRRDEIPVVSGDRSPAGLLSLSIAPPRWHGLELGIARYVQRIPATAEPLRERDLTLSLSYVNRGAEVRAEYARMMHVGIHSGRRFRSVGYYVLLSQRLNGRLSPLRPYFLFDRLDLARGEEYLRESRNEDAVAGGMRWDITSHFTLKAEGRSQRGKKRDHDLIVGLQLGVSF
jgi:hypothetical protein